MAFKVDRINGQHYAENIVNQALVFESGTWTVASGTGTAALNLIEPFVGVSSLRIQNNTPASDISVSNASQDTVIIETGVHQFSFYVKKDIAQEVRTGEIRIYQNAVLLTTEEFTIGSATASLDQNNVWVRFQGSELNLSKGDVITFQIQLDSAVTGESTTFIYVDGFMLNLAKRGNKIVPAYNKPDRFKDLPDLPTADGNYQLTVASGVLTWTTI